MRIGLALALCLGLAGCQETHHCEPGLYGNDCQFSLTTTMDASTPDVGVDAFVPDAGPCNGECEARGEVCYEGDDAGQAPGCVECVEHEDCRAMADAGVGDAGAADAGVLGVPLCVDFHCTIGCITSDDCAGNPCLGDGTCSAYPEAGQGVCEPCDTDANCEDGVACFEDPADATGGPHCLALRIDDCGLNERPFVRAPTGPSVDDDTPRTFCALPTWLTCEAYLDQQAGTPCTEASDCGRGVLDASCEMFAGATGPVCTYPCVQDPDGTTQSMDCALLNTCETLRPLNGDFCRRR